MAAQLANFDSNTTQEIIRRLSRLRIKDIKAVYCKAGRPARVGCKANQVKMLADDLLSFEKLNEYLHPHFRMRNVGSYDEQTCLTLVGGDMGFPCDPYVSLASLLQSMEQAQQAPNVGPTSSTAPAAAAGAPKAVGAGSSVAGSSAVTAEGHQRAALGAGQHAASAAQQNGALSAAAYHGQGAAQASTGLLSSRVDATHIDPLLSAADLSRWQSKYGGNTANGHINRPSDVRGGTVPSRENSKRHHVCSSCCSQPSTKRAPGTATAAAWPAAAAAAPAAVAAAAAATATAASSISAPTSAAAAQYESLRGTVSVRKSRPMPAGKSGSFTVPAASPTSTPAAAQYQTVRTHMVRKSVPLPARNSISPAASAAAAAAAASAAAAAAAAASAAANPHRAGAAMVAHPDPRRRSKRLWCFRTKLYRDVKGATAYFELPNTICLALDACFDKDSSKTYKLGVYLGPHRSEWHINMADMTLRAMNSQEQRKIKHRPHGIESQMQPSLELESMVLAVVWIGIPWKFAVQAAEKCPFDVQGARHYAEELHIDDLNERMMNTVMDESKRLTEREEEERRKEVLTTNMALDPFQNPQFSTSVLLRDAASCTSLAKVLRDASYRTLVVDLLNLEKNCINWYKGPAMKYFEELPGFASKRDGTAEALVKFLKDTLEELKAAVYLDTSGSNLPKLFETYRNYVYDTANAQLSELANDAAANSDNNAANAVLVIDDDDDGAGADAGKGGQGAETSFTHYGQDYRSYYDEHNDIFGEEDEEMYLEGEFDSCDDDY